MLHTRITQQDRATNGTLVAGYGWKKKVRLNYVAAAMQQKESAGSRHPFPAGISAGLLTRALYLRLSFHVASLRSGKTHMARVEFCLRTKSTKTLKYPST